VFAPDGGGGGFGRGGRGGGGFFGATPEAPGITAAPSGDPNADPLFQLVWTKPAADGSPANTAGQSLYGEAIDLTWKADAVVLVVGIDGSQEGEGRDRNAIELPAVQEGLVKAVTTAAGPKPVILVCCSGSSIALNWANEHVPAIFQAWYPGQRGDAVADVIFGKYNPAGRLPVTFYKSADDLPPFEDYAMKAGNGRTYRYFKGTPLYPFGYGLSYTSFEYSKMEAAPNLSTTQDLLVRVTVKNTGTVAGDEVVQLYFENSAPPIVVSGDPQGGTPISVADVLPPRTLVGFQRLPLKSGEERTVEFTVTPHQLGGAISEKERINLPRSIILRTGPSSRPGGGFMQLVSLTGDPAPVPYRFVAPRIAPSTAAAQP
jgi:beta-glucosidase